MITLLGPKKGDVCHCAEGGHHDQALRGLGWKWLGSLPAAEIRAFAPGRLPPRAKPETLAALVTAALMGGEPLLEKAAPKPKLPPAATRALPGIEVAD